jgi:hypothetical protein
MQKEFLWFELSKQAKEKAYRTWVRETIEDDLNWDLIMSYEEYENNVTFDRLSFDKDGNYLG